MRKLSEILIVDDDHINNFVTERLLLKLGITDKVVFKLNGKQGLDYLEEKCGSVRNCCPTFIIFDYNMPVMDGLEFFSKVKNLCFESIKEMVFLLLAVQIPEDLLKKFIELGIQNYTLKPLNESVVMDTYHKYWNKEGLWIG